MKVNSDKSHLLMFGNKKAKANIDNSYIGSEDLHEFPGMYMNSFLKTMLTH